MKEYQLCWKLWLCMSWCCPQLRCYKKAKSVFWEAWSPLFFPWYLSMKCPSELVQLANKLYSLGSPLFGFFLKSFLHLQTVGLVCFTLQLPLCLLGVMGDSVKHIFPRKTLEAYSKWKENWRLNLWSWKAFLLSHASCISVFTGYRSENSYKSELFPERTLVIFCALRILLLWIKYT